MRTELQEPLLFRSVCCATRLGSQKRNAPFSLPSFSELANIDRIVISQRIKESQYPAWILNGRQNSFSQRKNDAAGKAFLLTQKSILYIVLVRGRTYSSSPLPGSEQKRSTLLGQKAEEPIAIGAAQFSVLGIDHGRAIYVLYIPILIGKKCRQLSSLAKSNGVQVRDIEQRARRETSLSSCMFQR